MKISYGFWKQTYDVGWDSLWLTKQYLLLMNWHDTTVCCFGKYVGSCSLYIRPKQNAIQKKSLNKMSFDCSALNQHAHWSQRENHDYDSVCAFYTQRSQNYNQNFSDLNLSRMLKMFITLNKNQLHYFNYHAFDHLEKMCPKIWPKSIPCAHCQNLTENFVPEQRSQRGHLFPFTVTPIIKKSSQVDVRSIWNCLNKYHK